MTRTEYPPLLECCRGMWNHKKDCPQMTQRNEAAERLPVHWMTGSSSVRCGAPMKSVRHPDGWTLGTASAAITRVTCKQCKP